MDGILLSHSPSAIWLGSSGIRVNSDGTITVTGAITFGTVFEIADDVLLTLGNDNDQVLVNRSTSLAANTALTNVLVSNGAISTPALAANSLIISNVAASGDILMAGVRGAPGNSEAFLFYDSSARTLSFVGTPLLLDGEGSGARIQDGGAEVVHIRDSTNARGLNITLTAVGNQTIASSGGRLILGYSSGALRRSLQLDSAQNDQLSFLTGSAANPSIYGFSTVDEDGTDNIYNIVYGKGGLATLVNTEELVMGYVAATTEFIVRSSAAGTGTQRELSLQTGTTKRIRMNSTGLGLYDVTPVARAAAIAAPTGGATIDVEARTAIDSIRTALTNIGLTS